MTRLKKWEYSRREASWNISDVQVECLVTHGTKRHWWMSERGVGAMYIVSSRSVFRTPHKQQQRVGTRT